MFGEVKERNNRKVSQRKGEPEDFKYVCECVCVRERETMIDRIR